MSKSNFLSPVDTPDIRYCIIVYMSYRHEIDTESEIVKLYASFPLKSQLYLKHKFYYTAIFINPQKFINTKISMIEVYCVLEREEGAACFYIARNNIDKIGEPKQNIYQNRIYHDSPLIFSI